MPITNREKLMAAVLIVVIVAAVLVSLYRIRSTGTIKAVGVGVFWDKNMTQWVSNIDWGLLGPGDLAGVTVYIKNIKTVNLTLTFNCTAWQPSTASMYIHYSWNYSGEVIEPLQVVPVQIMLLVDTSITDIDVFSNDINIYAYENV